MNNNTKDIEGNLYVWCHRESGYRPVELFEKYNENNGYYMSCRECDPDSYFKFDQNHKGARQLLTALGYDVNSDKSVHQQFTEKWKIYEKTRRN